MIFLQPKFSAVPSHLCHWLKVSSHSCLFCSSGLLLLLGARLMVRQGVFPVVLYSLSLTEALCTQALRAVLSQHPFPSKWQLNSDLYLVLLFRGKYILAPCLGVAHYCFLFMQDPCLKGFVSLSRGWKGFLSPLPRKIAIASAPQPEVRDFHLGPGGDGLCFSPSGLRLLLAMIEGFG